MRKAINYIRKELSGLYPDTEINSFVYIIYDHVLNLSRLEIHTKPDFTIPNSAIEQIRDIVQQLKAYKPIQYILGKTDFYHLKLQVTPAVLIPRPETEELVDWIIRSANLDSENQPLRILDIGTGSGCIAIALAKHFKNAQVEALDISEEALKVAEQNAKHNWVSVNFFRADVFKLNGKPLDSVKFFREGNKTGESSEQSAHLFDVIVSNPPYVRELEKQQMHANVLNYEPHQALFVPDSQPLIYYEAIARFASQHLLPNGRIYLEINENLAIETAALLRDKNFTQVFVKKDINGKQRMISAVKKNN